MHVLSNRKGFDAWSPTIGINTGARMSTFAAGGGIGHDQHDTGAGTDDLAIGGRIEAGRVPLTVHGRQYLPSYSSYNSGPRFSQRGAAPAVTQYVAGSVKYKG